MKHIKVLIMLIGITVFGILSGCAAANASETILNASTESAGTNEEIFEESQKTESESFAEEAGGVTVQSDKSYIYYDGFIYSGTGILTDQVFTLAEKPTDDEPHDEYNYSYIGQVVEGSSETVPAENLCGVNLEAGASVYRKENVDYLNLYVQVGDAYELFTVDPEYNEICEVDETANGSSSPEKTNDILAVVKEILPDGSCIVQAENTDQELTIENYELHLIGDYFYDHPMEAGMRVNIMYSGEECTETGVTLDTVITMIYVPADAEQ